ncbi:hypothetical protein B0H14DRAFT_3549800 [Mycena olivaceomarginata]|nr:hypothetical protein B0H14DRAFT_3549800 [Mycena olivaceomarginata]
MSPNRLQLLQEKQDLGVLTRIAQQWRERRYRAHEVHALVALEKEQTILHELHQLTQEFIDLHQKIDCLREQHRAAVCTVNPKSDRMSLCQSDMMNFSLEQGISWKESPMATQSFPLSFTQNERAEDICTGVPPQYQLQGLSLANTTQATFYAAIRPTRPHPERIKRSSDEVSSQRLGGQGKGRSQSPAEGSQGQIACVDVLDISGCLLKEYTCSNIMLGNHYTPSSTSTRGEYFETLDDPERRTSVKINCTALYPRITHSTNTLPQTARRCGEWTLLPAEMDEEPKDGRAKEFLKRWIYPFLARIWSAVAVVATTYEEYHALLASGPVMIAMILAVMQEAKVPFAAPKTAMVTTFSLLLFAMLLLAPIINWSTEGVADNSSDSIVAVICLPLLPNYKSSHRFRRSRILPV